MIEYVTADAADLPDGESVMLCHVVNDAGLWGAGFAAALDARFPGVGERYKAWHAGDAVAGGGATHFGRGQTQFVVLSPHGPQVVANMVAVRGVRSRRNPVPLCYVALEVALEAAARRAAKLGATLRMPRIGCGLAGGTWDRVGPILETICTLTRVRAVVCDPPATPKPCGPSAPRSRRK